MNSGLLLRMHSQYYCVHLFFSATAYCRAVGNRMLWLKEWTEELDCLQQIPALVSYQLCGIQQAN